MAVINTIFAALFLTVWIGSFRLIYAKYDAFFSVYFLYGLAFVYFMVFLLSIKRKSWPLVYALSMFSLIAIAATLYLNEDAFYYLYKLTE